MKKSSSFFALLTAVALVLGTGGKSQSTEIFDSQSGTKLQDLNLSSRLASLEAQESSEASVESPDSTNPAGFVRDGDKNDDGHADQGVTPTKKEKEDKEKKDKADKIAKCDEDLKVKADKVKVDKDKSDKDTDDKFNGDKSDKDDEFEEACKKIDNDKKLSSKEKNSRKDDEKKKYDEDCKKIEDDRDYEHDKSKAEKDSKDDDVNKSHEECLVVAVTPSDAPVPPAATPAPVASAPVTNVVF